MRTDVMTDVTATERFAAYDLLSLATALFERVGLATPRAKVVAEVLVEGDLIGHSTHGLQLAARHLQGIEVGAVAKSGEPRVIADQGSAVTWDGCWLPGPWLVREALDLAFERASIHPVVTFVIRSSGHIGCLAAYPRIATERNLMMILTSSDPAVSIVAPHGSCEGRYTPNPIAAGWPTDAEPIILDVCPSTTTAGMAGRMAAAGASYEGPWLVSGNGELSNDPAVLQQSPPGAILPLGGAELGHKGFALGLLVEALTSALSGFGRADNVRQDGASVFLQVINPSFFAGADAFRREASWLAHSCRSARTRPGVRQVRMPGERGLDLRKTQLRDGVGLHPDTLNNLSQWAKKLNVPMPPPLRG